MAELLPLYLWLSSLFCKLFWLLFTYFSLHGHQLMYIGSYSHCGIVFSFAFSLKPFPVTLITCYSKHINPNGILMLGTDFLSKLLISLFLPPLSPCQKVNDRPI